MTARQTTKLFTVAATAMALITGCASHQAATTSDTTSAAVTPGMQAAKMSGAERSAFMADFDKKRTAELQQGGAGASGKAGAAKNPKALAMIMNHMTPQQRIDYVAKHPLPPPPAPKTQ